MAAHRIGLPCVLKTLARNRLTHVCRRILIYKKSALSHGRLSSRKTKEDHRVIWSPCQVFITNFVVNLLKFKNRPSQGYLSSRKTMEHQRVIWSPCQVFITNFDIKNRPQTDSTKAICKELMNEFRSAAAVRVNISLAAYAHVSIIYCFPSDNISSFDLLKRSNLQCLS